MLSNMLPIVMNNIVHIYCHINLIIPQPCLLARLVSALRHLHRNHINHGDLKIENMLVTKNFSLKIFDFGYTKVRGYFVGEFHLVIFGTPLTSMT